MWSVSYHAPQTVSESCYVIFRLWNCIASIYLQFLHCRLDIQRLLNIIILEAWLSLLFGWIEPTNMATGARWQDPISLETIQIIVKKIIPTWTVACTWYSSNSSLQSSMVKIFSAALQLETENQQPSLFLALFSNTMCIWIHAPLDFQPEKDPLMS